MKKKRASRLLSLMLGVSMALGLALPASAAGNDGPQPVYQGDGYYITVTEYGNQKLFQYIPNTTLFSDGLIAFYDRELDSYGFADKDGNVVLSPETLANSEYDIFQPPNISSELFSDGRLLVCVDTDDGWKYGYVDRSGQFVIPPIYVNAQPFVDGTAVVATEVSNEPYRGTRYSWNFIDTSGNVLLADVGGQDAEEQEPSPLSEGLFFQLTDGRRASASLWAYEYGIFDRDGDLLTRINTEELFGGERTMFPLGGYSEGYLVLDTGWNPETTVLDTEGNVVWSSTEDLPGSYTTDDELLYHAGVHNGLLVLSDRYPNYSVVVNVETGELLISPEDWLQVMDDFRDGLATVIDVSPNSGAHYGVVDTEGNDVIPTGEFEWISPFNEGLAIARLDGLYYLLEKHEGTHSGQLPQEEEPAPDPVYEYGVVPENALLQANATCTGSTTVTDWNGTSRTVYLFPAGTVFTPKAGMTNFQHAENLSTGEVQYLSQRFTLPESGAYKLVAYDQGIWEDTVCVMADGSTAQPEQPAPTFTDVTADKWYYDFVETVAEKKLFAGNGDGTFAPEANMTYAEFLAVLFQFSGDTLPTGSGPNWYDNHIQWAKDHDLIPAGMLNGFDPEAAITRQDMAALFGSFLSNYDYTAAPVNSGTPSFSDGASIADYARDGVELCYQLGIMGGNDDGTFAPGNTAIRAEVAVTMVQMARVMGR